MKRAIKQKDVEIIKTLARLIELMEVDLDVLSIFSRFLKLPYEAQVEFVKGLEEIIKGREKK